MREKTTVSLFFTFLMHCARFLLSLMLGVCTFFLVATLCEGIIFSMEFLRELLFCSIYKGPIILPFGSLMSHSEFCPVKPDTIDTLWFNIIKFAPAAYSAVEVAVLSAPERSKRIAGGVFVSFFILMVLAHPLLAYLYQENIPINGEIWKPGNFTIQTIYLVASLIAFYQACIHAPKSNPVNKTASPEAPDSEDP
jgi:hypothetical protein